MQNDHQDQNQSVRTHKQTMAICFCFVFIYLHDLFNGYIIYTRGQVLFASGPNLYVISIIM